MCGRRLSKKRQRLDGARWSPGAVPLAEIAMTHDGAKRRNVRGSRFSVHSDSEPAAVLSILSANSRGLRPLRDR